MRLLGRKYGPLRGHFIFGIFRGGKNEYIGGKSVTFGDKRGKMIMDSIYMLPMFVYRVPKGLRPRGKRISKYYALEQGVIIMLSSGKLCYQWKSTQDAKPNKRVSHIQIKDRAGTILYFAVLDDLIHRNVLDLSACIVQDGGTTREIIGEELDLVRNMLRGID